MDCPVGTRFGFLVVTGPAPPAENGGERWTVLCDCGKTTEKRVTNLRYGGTRSCGCAQGGGGRIRFPGRVGNDRARFDVYVKKLEAEPGCWEWTGLRDEDGYGIFSEQIEGEKPLHKDGKKKHVRKVSAHRWAYEHFVGSIPDDKEIDHLCTRIPGGLGPPCVRPDHLEPVTQEENTRRGENYIGVNMRKTHCIRGHEFTPENTYVQSVSSGGGRGCVTCRRQRQRNRRDKKSKM